MQWAETPSPQAAWRPLRGPDCFVVINTRKLLKWSVTDTYPRAPGGGGWEDNGVQRETTVEGVGPMVSWGGSRVNDLRAKTTPPVPCAFAWRTPVDPEGLFRGSPGVAPPPLAGSFELGVEADPLEALPADLRHGQPPPTGEGGARVGRPVPRME